MQGIVGNVGMKLEGDGKTKVSLKACKAVFSRCVGGAIEKSEEEDRLWAKLGSPLLLLSLLFDHPGIWCPVRSFFAVLAADICFPFGLDE